MTLTSGPITLGPYRDSVRVVVNPANLPLSILEGVTGSPDMMDLGLDVAQYGLTIQIGDRCVTIKEGAAGVGVRQ